MRLCVASPHCAFGCSGGLQEAECNPADALISCVVFVQCVRRCREKAIREVL